MIIRKMELEDIIYVAEIEKQCFSLPWSSTEIEKTHKSEHSMYCVAVFNNKVVGYIGALIVLDEGNIINVAVDNQYRRQGVAKGLLEYLLSEAKKEGVKNFTLEVRENNTNAISLYKSFGFGTAGIRKNFYERPVENAVIMWKYDI